VSLRPAAPPCDDRAKPEWHCNLKLNWSGFAPLPAPADNGAPVGGLISGDQVTVDFDPCPCGRRGMTSCSPSAGSRTSTSRAMTAGRAPNTQKSDAKDLRDCQDQHRAPRNGAPLPCEPKPTRAWAAPQPLRDRGKGRAFCASTGSSCQFRPRGRCAGTCRPVHAVEEQIR